MGYDDRNTSLILKAGEITKTIVVTQKQKDALILTKDKFEVDKTGGTINIEVKSNLDYEVIIPEACKSWINQSPKTKGLTINSILLDIAASTQYYRRKGELTIKSGNLSNTVQIYQAGEVAVDGVEITSINLNASQKELDLNETLQLIATIQPDNATNKNITWKSSNESVASVSQNGWVKAKSTGETIITVLAERSNFTASCTIIVKKKQEIGAYIDADIRIDGLNTMGQFWGVINSKITNNSDEPISLISMKIINGDGKTIFFRHYDSQILNSKDSYNESADGLPSISQPTIIWTYEYNNKEYTISKMSER